MGDRRAQRHLKAYISQPHAIPGESRPSIAARFKNGPTVLDQARRLATTPRRPAATASAGVLGQEGAGRM